MSHTIDASRPGLSRRNFLKASAGVAALEGALPIGMSAYAAGSDIIRVGVNWKLNW